MNIKEAKDSRERGELFDTDVKVLLKELEDAQEILKSIVILSASGNRDRYLKGALDNIHAKANHYMKSIEGADNA